MYRSLFVFLFFATIPGAAHALIEVGLSSLAQTAPYKTRLVDGKPCTRGIVASVELKSTSSAKQQWTKNAVMEIRNLNGIGRDSNALLARVTFSGSDSGTGLAMSHLVYVDSTISHQVEVCANGDIKINRAAPRR